MKKRRSMPALNISREDFIDRMNRFIGEKGQWQCFGCGTVIPCTLAICHHCDSALQSINRAFQEREGKKPEHIELQQGVDAGKLYDTIVILRNHHAEDQLAKALFGDDA